MLSLTEAPNHSHMQARGVFADLGGRVLPKVAPRFSETPGLDPTSERAVGQDTVATLLAWGWHQSEIDAALASGAISQRADDQ